MVDQKEAVIPQGSKVPVYRSAELAPPKEDEVTVQVLAAGFHHLVKGRALGHHYSARGASGDADIGVDGVGLVDGQTVYFFNLGPGGTYRRYVNVKKTNTFAFPSDATSPESVARVAALSNAAMASGFALGCRMPDLKPNSTVAILGVTGASGQMAVQVAKKVYGAKTVIGVGRNASKLDKLKQSQPLLDTVVTIDDTDEKIASTFSDVDVVLDFLWGEPATRFLDVVVKTKADSAKPVYWVQIGQMAGDAKVEVAAAYLRSTNLYILGSGIGPIGRRDMVGVFAQNTKLLAEGTLDGPVVGAKLSDIAQEWDAPWDAQIRKYFKVD